VLRIWLPDKSSVIRLGHRVAASQEFGLPVTGATDLSILHPFPEDRGPKEKKGNRSGPMRSSLVRASNLEAGTAV